MTLPGSGFFSFPDELEPVLDHRPDRLFRRPFQVAGTYNYAPITGQRDILGYIRAPQPGSTGTGYGSNPFIDIGAYQYVNLHPPEVTGVTETPTRRGHASQLLHVGRATAGVNQTPWTINVTFNGPIRPEHDQRQHGQARRPGQQPQPAARPAHQPGRQAVLRQLDRHLIINLGASRLDPGDRRLPDHPVRQRFAGDHQPQGVALDGENTVGGTSTGAQLAAPLGQRLPRRQFLRLVHHQHHAAFGPGRLAQDGPRQRHQHRRRQHHHDRPAHLRRQRSASPTHNWCRWPARPRSSTSASRSINGVLTTYFDPTQLPSNLSQPRPVHPPQRRHRPRPPPAAPSRSPWGSTEPIPGSSPTPARLPDLTGTYNVGADGILSPLPGDDSGYYVARVRIIDQSGNQSNPTDPNAQVPFVVDDTPPTVTVHLADPRPGDHQPDQRRRSRSRSRPARTST